jgi:LPS O-antigen subunit length determinant protein (WzzB/FepE family)
VQNSIKVQRTQFGAIAISVMDQSPQFAADMANEIVRQLDFIKNQVEHERAEAAYQLLLKQSKRYEDEIARINDSIRNVMNHGVFDYSSQSERLQQQRAIAVAQGNAGAIQRLDKELANLAIWGPKALHFQEYLMTFREYQTLCQSKILDAQMDLDNGMPVKFIIEKATVPDKKDHPKKMMIVIVSTVGAFIFSIFVLLILQNIKSRIAVIKKEETDQE